MSKSAHHEGIETIREVLLDMLNKLANPAYQQALIGDLMGVTSEMESLMTRKGGDYSGARNHHWANFQINASVTGLTVDQVFLSLMGVKFSRLSNLLSGEGRAPNFESISDSWMDFANYIVLLIGYKRFMDRFDEEGARDQ